MSDINFNTSPYYDDYDEDKNFHRILFKPGVSVQARELTQLQTILQKQIERHGTSIYKEGARVVNGELTFTNNLRGIKILSRNGTDNVSDYLDQLEGKVLIGATSGVRGIVTAVAAETATDPITLYVNYITNGVDKVTPVFADDENLLTESGVFSYSAGQVIATTVASDAAVTGIGCSITAGVFYTKGAFVLCEPQTVIVSKYTANVDARIGLRVNEQIITSSDDESLLDNATGSPNFSASGADRYAIELELTSIAEDSEDDDNFIELERVRGGRLQGRVRASELSNLESKIAKRTFDLNGNVETTPFNLKIRESVNDFTNTGVYAEGATTESGNVASESLMALQISEGKAYVEGYELGTVGNVFVDIEKARDFESVTGASTTLEVGNYVLIKNLHGLPDIVDLGGSVTNYGVVELRDTFTDSAGVAQGEIIGYARPRSLEFNNGSSTSSVDVFDSDANFKLFLFDVNMITEISLDSDALADNIVTGTRIKGANSYASGIVDSSSTAGNLRLTGVSGAFVVGEELFTNNYDSANGSLYVQNTSATNNVSVASVTQNTFDAVKQIYFDDPTLDFTADIDLESTFTLSGSVTVSGGSTAVSGFNTRFLNELRVGDAISVPTGASGAQEIRIVSAISSNTSLTLDTAVTNAVTSTSATRLRAFLNDQDKFLSLRKMPKDYIKTVTNKDIEVRRQFLATSNTSGVAQITSAGSTFNAESNTDYQITVLVPGSGGSATAGQMVNINSSDLSVTGDGTDTLTFTSLPIFGQNAQLKITATIRFGSTSSKAKTANIASLLKVENKKNDTGERVWGTSAHQEEISLGVADAYRILAVYDSMDSADAAPPSMVVSGASGAFTDRETISGASSGAQAIVLDTSSPLRYVLLSDLDFQEGEVITGLSSSSTATVSTITAGDNNITDRYLFDDGQRDNYYDISRLILKPKAAKPVGELLIVFNYFSHGSGQFIDVNSYSGVDYKEIPFYTSTRIDPEIRNPIGSYDLRSAVDYRPRVADATRTGPDGDGAYKVTGRSLGFDSRSYSGTGSSVSSTPKDNSNFANDHEYYLPRIDSVFLTTTGKFVVQRGVSEENPSIPNKISGGIKICDIYMNPYVINVDFDVTVEQKNYKNYRKEDIAKLESRINNIEYYTSLSLLETSASRLQIKDANGLDRFKSGFLVDNFGGHKTGQVDNQDYRCAIDFVSRSLRTKQSIKNIPLREINTTNTQRTLDNYARTGNIVTLPYTEVATVTQPYATRVENLNPALSFSWTGGIKLTPTSDEWFETEFLPDITVNRDGNFNAVLAANQNRLGTVWGSTQLTWTGQNVEQDSREINRTRRFIRAADGDFNFNIFEQNNRLNITTTTTTDTFTRTRWGIETNIAERITTRLEDDRVVSTELIPFMRSKKIEFQAHGLKPFTRVYPYFDNVNVSNFTVQRTGSVVGTSVATRSVDAAGSWTTLSGVRLKSLWSQNYAGDTKSVTVSYFTNENLTSGTTLGTASTFNTRTSADLDVAGGPFAVSPNADGDLWIKIEISPLDAFGLSDIEFFDQSSSAISRNIIELVKFDNINYRGASNNTWAFTNNDGRDWQNMTNVERESLNRTATLVFRLRDGVKSNVPQSGSIRITDNSTINQSALVADATGRVAGTFTIPDPNVTGNPKFRTGERIFRLTSNEDNSEANLETFAQSRFTSTGILQKRQRTFIATRNAEIITRQVTRTDNIVEQQVDVQRTVLDRSEPQFVRQQFWIDPLAQSCVVSSEGGEFLTKIDIFFAAKDDSIPVELQLREMENGQITNSVIPGSRVVVDPENITTSADGSAGTSFVFESPLYIREGVEFAIVLLTDSPNYTVFISRMGEIDLQGARTVSKQPYLGVLFKSQNNSTWTPYDYEDLKFTIYRASFDTSVTGILNLENLPVPDKKLGTSPIECFEGSNVIKVSHVDHHMYNANNDVSIRGVTSGTTAILNGAITDADSDMTLSNASGFPTSGTVSLRIVNTDPDYVVEYGGSNGEVAEIVSGTISGSGSTRTVTGMTRGRSPGFSALDHADGLTVELYQYNGIDLNQINTTHDIVDWGIDYYTISIADTATENLTFGGSNVYASENALITNYQILVPTNIHTNTSIAPAITLTSGTSPSGTETSFSVLPETSTQLIDEVELSSVRMIASSVNETNNFSNNKSCNVKLSLTSSAENLSPVVDLERNSIVALSNRLDNIESSADYYPASEYVAPTAAEGDLGEGIYITKQVQLELPATALKVYLNANVFSSSNLKVMYKVLRTDESTNFSEIGWNYFNEDGSSDDIVPPATNVSQMQEYEYSEDDLPEFISFAIKIKLDGTNAAVPPICKDLRAIALAV